jgi:hypothetical protein
VRSETTRAAGSIEHGRNPGGTFFTAANCCHDFPTKGHIMTRITAIAATAILAALASSPAFSQSSEGPAKSGDTAIGTDGGKGTTGWTGGSTQTDPGGNGSGPKYYQPPVATGLDLKGPTKTEGPFAE